MGSSCCCRPTSSNFISSNGINSVIHLDNLDAQLIKSNSKVNPRFREGSTTSTRNPYLSNSKGIDRDRDRDKIEYMNDKEKKENFLSKNSKILKISQNSQNPSHVSSDQDSSSNTSRNIVISFREEDSSMDKQLARLASSINNTVRTTSVKVKVSKHVTEEVQSILSSPVNKSRVKYTNNSAQISEKFIGSPETISVNRKSSRLISLVGPREGGGFISPQKTLKSPKFHNSPISKVLASKFSRNSNKALLKVNVMDKQSITMTNSAIRSAKKSAQGTPAKSPQIQAITKARDGRDGRDNPGNPGSSVSFINNLVAAKPTANRTKAVPVKFQSKDNDFINIRDEGGSNNFSNSNSNSVSNSNNFLRAASGNTSKNNMYRTSGVSGASDYNSNLETRAYLSYKLSDKNVNGSGVEIINYPLSTKQVAFIFNILTELDYVNDEMDQETLCQIIGMIKIFKLDKNAVVSTGNYLIIIDSGKVKDYDEPEDSNYLSKGDVISISGVEKKSNQNTYTKLCNESDDDEFSSSSDEDEEGRNGKSQKNEKIGKNEKFEKKSKKTMKNKIHSFDLLKTISPSQIFAIPSDLFHNLLQQHNEKLTNDKLKFLSNILIFKFLEERKLLQLCEFTRKKFYYKQDIQKGEEANIILSEEETPDRIYIIASGTVKCQIKQPILHTLHTKRLSLGDSFGDIALFCQMESLFTYSCSEDVVLYEIKYTHIIEIIHEKGCENENYLKNIIFTIFLNTMKNSMNSVFSRHLAKPKINNFFNLFELRYYFKDVVMTQKNPKLCIIISGNLLSNSKNLSKIGKVSLKSVSPNSNLNSANNSPIKNFKKHLTSKNLNNINLNENHIPNVQEISSSKNVNQNLNTNKNLNLTKNSNKIKNSKNLDKNSEQINLVGSPGDLFGDIILDNNLSMNNMNYSPSSNVVSEDECIIFEANWHELLKCFKPENNSTNSSLYDRILILKNSLHLNNYSIFASLSEWKLFLLADKLQVETFKDKEQIASNIHDSIYIVKSGKVQIFLDNSFFKEISQNESFGEISGFKLYSKPMVYIANGKVEMYILNKISFDEVMEGIEDNGERENQNSYKNNLSTPYIKRSTAVYKDETVKLHNLFYVKDLGHGSFGKVFKVHNGKSFYAVKVAEVKNCHKNKLFKYFINEKTIMSCIDHPFIVKLINTFKNKEHIFIIMECIDGLNLSQYLERRKKIKNKKILNKNRSILSQSPPNLYEAQFYGAILLTIANYFQRIRVIHRDIKPANCMIDRSGYLKLIDFGVAKDLSSRDHTSTLIGTSHYMAPEIILGKGYSFSADYWSIGIVMYEIFYGSLPFGSGSMGLLEVYDEITEKAPPLINDPALADFNDFIKNILHKDPNKRICNLQIVRNHSFFKNLKFESLFNFSLNPPVRKGLEKLNSLASYHDDEEILAKNRFPFRHYIENEYYSRAENDCFSGDSVKHDDWLENF